MNFPQSLQDELESKYLNMLNDQAEEPMSYPDMGDYQVFERKNAAYRQRLEQEFSRFNNAVSDIRAKRDRRIKSENNEIERRAEQKAHRKYVCAKTFKAIALFLPIIIAIFVGIDIFSNRAIYEVKVSYGGVITGWVFFALISAVLSILALVKLFTKEIYHNRNRIDNTRTYRTCSIVSFVMVAILCLANFGTYIKWGIDEASELTAHIATLPQSDSIDYTEYDDDIAVTYATYNSMDFWQKPLVENRDDLLKIIPGYNQYKVENVRTSMALITLDSVSNEGVLSNAVELYTKLTNEQIALLSKDELSQFDTYVTVNKVVNRLYEINDDVIDQYDTIDSILSVYLSIDDEYKPFVYNYSLVAGFEKRYDYINSFQFEKIENGYSIGLKEGKIITGELSVPERYKNELVTVIRDSAFINNNAITSVIVPNGVEQIGYAAFQGCNSIQEMTLPFTGRSSDASAYEAVLGYIFGYETKTRYSGYRNDNTFINTVYGSSDSGIWQYSCIVSGQQTSFYYYIPKSLKKVTIENQSVVKIAAFNGCDKIESIDYTQIITEFGEAACQNCKQLTTFNSESLGQANLSGTYGELGKHALGNCILINKIIIPNGVTTIGEYAFENLALTDVNIPNSVDMIDIGALKGCNRLGSISIPFVGRSMNASAYEAVLGYIFGYETKTRYSGYRNDNTFINTVYGSSDSGTWQYSCIVSGQQTSFYYYIPNTLRSVTVTKQSTVPIAAFNGCNMLTNITYSRGISSRGDYAFQNCSASVR